VWVAVSGQASAPELCCALGVSALVCLSSSLSRFPRISENEKGVDP
jgi:hypothetical protein